MSENGSEDMTVETEHATLDAAALERDAPPGKPSAFRCPDCGGVLWELDDEELLRFRCRVGHVENALWAGLRALQERAPLSERLAERVGGAGAKHSRARFEELAADARTQAEAILRLPAGNGSDG